MKNVAVSSYFLSKGFPSFSRDDFFFQSGEWGFTFYLIPFSMHTGNEFLAVRKLGNLMQ